MVVSVNKAGTTVAGKIGEQGSSEEDGIFTHVKGNLCVNVDYAYQKDIFSLIKDDHAENQV